MPEVTLSAEVREELRSALLSVLRCKAALINRNETLEAVLINNGLDFGEFSDYFMTAYACDWPNGSTVTDAMLDEYLEKCVERGDLTLRQRHGNLLVKSIVLPGDQAEPGS